MFIGGFFGFHLATNGCGGILWGAGIGYFVGFVGALLYENNRLNQKKAREDALDAARLAALMPSQVHPIYLQVPYNEKDQAKDLGARWDPAAKAWFIPPGVPSEPFVRWRAKEG